MSRVVFALALLAAAVVQGTLLPGIVPGLVLPNPVLVLVLVRTANLGVVDGLIAAAVGGVVLDVLALDPFGTNGLALLAAVLAGLAARRPVFHSRLLFPMLLAVAATFLYAGLLAIARLLGGDPAPALQAGFGPTFLQGLLNALLIPLFFGVDVMLGRFVPARSR